MSEILLGGNPITLYMLMTSLTAEVHYLLPENDILAPTIDLNN